jgi:protein SCO1
MIMAQAKRAVAQLTEAEQSEVTFMGVTLDPENDSRETMTAMARGQGVSAPQFHLLTGTPDAVNPVLDHMGVMRRWNEELKTIDHTNIFIVLDRDGMVAYRFSLGERQEEWLVEALRLVLAEKPGPTS